jgi:Tol biopolymer transport system component
MSDDVLRRNLRVVDSAMRPNPVFVDDLHAQLAAELGFEASPRPAQRVRAPARPQFRRRGRLGWLAVAALLVLALMALLLSQLGRTTVEPPPPPSSSPTSQPSAPPSSQPSGAPSPAVSLLPIADASPAPNNLRSDGLIVYESDAMSGLSRLRLLRPDLSSVELLPDVTDAQFGAAWRPDGERIAYAGFDPAVLRSPLRIWETDAQGAQPVLLSEGCDPPTCVAEYEPSYSPDGSQLVFVRTRLPEGGEEESVVATRDLETGAVTELDATRRPRRAAENLHPRWSPDGQTIAYAVSDYDEFGFPGNSRIHLVDADGSDERTITAPDLHAGEPEWSRDGETILFATNPFRPVLRAVGGGAGTSPRLGVMDADGSNVRQFDFGSVLVGPSWAANGEQILFTLMEGRGIGEQRPFNPRLFVMDADGSRVLPLSRNPGDALYGVQQPSP